MDTAEAMPVDGKLRVVRGAGAKPKSAAAQLEHSHDAAMLAIAAVSSHLASDEHLPNYFARVTATIAQVTGATRAAFWRLGPRGTLAVQVAPHGFPNNSPVYDVRLQLSPNGRGAVERLVFADELELSSGTAVDLDQAWHDAGLTKVTNSIGASWTAGGRRIGALVAFDSPNGFTTHDLWVLRLVGMVAGVKQQY